MVDKKVIVAVDGMGGDFAPAEIVKGIYLAAQADTGAHFFLVGRTETLEKELDKLAPLDNVSLKQASDVVKMGDYTPLMLRSKGDTSIAVGLRLVKEKQADAFVSAGDTGAVMSASLLTLGRLKGVLRPAIAIVIPTPQRPVVLLDAGANADYKPENMVQFAQIGSAYASKILGVANPTIGLLNIGEEEKKGSVLVQNTYHLLKETNLNFVGSVEGTDIPQGKVDVVVTDGFTGNVVLKLLEGAAEMLFSEVKSVVNSSLKTRIGGYFLASGLRELKQKLDHEEYGGAQLLGTNGVTIISHGSSKAKAVKNAAALAAKTVRQGVLEEIEKSI